MTTYLLSKPLYILVELLDWLPKQSNKEVTGGGVALWSDVPYILAG